jgi:hypothetical protein
MTRRVSMQKVAAPDEWVAFNHWMMCNDDAISKVLIATNCKIAARHRQMRPSVVTGQESLICSFSLATFLRTCDVRANQTCCSLRKISSRDLGRQYRQFSFSPSFDHRSFRLRLDAEDNLFSTCDMLLCRDTDVASVHSKHHMDYPCSPGKDTKGQTRALVSRRGPILW